MIIAVDFDGTIAEHRFPDIGPEIDGASYYLEYFQKLGAKLILYTMRSDSQEHGDLLKAAIEFCRDELSVEFWDHNKNPEQSSWSSSPKVYANYYIDDAAIGCPLIYPKDGRRPYVDWDKVGPMVLELIKKGQE